MKKYFVIYLIIAVMLLNGCSVEVKTENNPDMFISPAELNETEQKILNLVGEGKTKIFNFSINEDVKSMKFKVTDYSDADNPKVVDLFGFNNESGSLKGRLSVSFSNENEIKVAVETGDSTIHGSSRTDKIDENIADKSSGTSLCYLHDSYEISIEKPVPLAVILKTDSDVRSTYFVENYISNPNLFKQYDNSYLLTVTFYDKHLNELPD
jgi:hypothetical protein